MEKIDFSQGISNGIATTLFPSSHNPNRSDFDLEKWSSSQFNIIWTSELPFYFFSTLHKTLSTKPLFWQKLINSWEIPMYWQQWTRLPLFVIFFVTRKKVNVGNTLNGSVYDYFLWMYAYGIFSARSYDLQKNWFTDGENGMLAATNNIKRYTHVVQCLKEKKQYGTAATAHIEML